MKKQDRVRELKKRLYILTTVIAVLTVLLIWLIARSAGSRPARKSAGDSTSLSQNSESGMTESSLSAGETVSSARGQSAVSETQSAGADSAQSSVRPESSAESAGREALPIDEQELVTTDMSVDWRLVLVNPKHALPDDYEVETSVIAYTNDEDRVFDSRAVDALDEMLSDCRDAGFDPVLRASYRTWSTQEYLFDRKVGQMLDDGYSQSGAEAKAATIVAVPGTSEHQLGLAADIASQSTHSLTAAEADTPVQQWLMEHCVDYGFILRFPDGKSEYTGIIYEPWHYRYVGKEYAKAITDSGMCLEEYLAANGIGN